MAKKMYDLGYLQNLDKSAIPNVEENLIPSLQSPTFDPERDFSVPWQSGMTGIIVRKDLAPDVTSINDLFDPKYKGKVTFLTEMRDTVPLVMKADGDRPGRGDRPRTGSPRSTRSSEAVGLRSDPRLHRQRLRRRPDAAATSSRRSAGRATRSSCRPTTRTSSGGCRTRAACSWSDNMVIPVGAPNTAAALAFMDYVYDPEVAGRRSPSTSSTSPRSRASRRSSTKRDPELAKNQLIFPDEEFTAELHDPGRRPRTSRR